MGITFPFEKKPSPIFGSVYRPVAPIQFWSKAISGWSEILVVVDTGADYTMLPRYWAKNLGINLEKDTIAFKTSGIGGEEKSYFIKSWKVKLSTKELIVPLGFLDRDNVPPLLGRQDFLELMSVTFNNHNTLFNFDTD